MGKNEVIHALAGQSAQILDEVIYHREQGVEKSRRLDGLFARGGEIERRINAVMIADPNCFISSPLAVNGKEIAPEVADYCLRHYSSSGITEVNGINAYGNFALESAPSISRFVGKIEGLKGQRILTANETNLLEEGVIDGKCQFMRERGFRHLVVPIRDGVSFVSGGQPRDYIFVNPDFFSFNAQGKVISLGHQQEVCLTTDYNKAQFIGGTPENIYLYAGDNLVERKKREFRGMGVEV